MSHTPQPPLASLNHELAAAGGGLADNVDVLRAVLSGCGDCIKILDLDGRLQFMSEGGKRVMEVTDFGALKGCPWPDFWTDAANADAKSAVTAARSGETYRFSGSANTAKGNPRRWDVQVSPIFGEDGEPSHILSISRDITLEWNALAELKEANERQSFLAQELQHRIKNTLAMVSAIANQTLRGDEVKLAREAFTSRLVTLAKAHDILTRGSWVSAPVREIVQGAIAPHRTSQNQIEIGGPDFDLPPKQALALALAIHELATNDAKNGALSNGKGVVEIGWVMETANHVPSFGFKWEERDGPPVRAPAAAKVGFGTRLIERMLSNEFGVEIAIDYRPCGVVCEMSVPIGTLQGAAS